MCLTRTTDEVERICEFNCKIRMFLDRGDCGIKVFSVGGEAM